MATKKREDAQIDLTPMIDVVFQLIIFFIVTIKMEQEYADIELEPAYNGPAIEDDASPLTIEIEVDRRGWISIHNAQMTRQQLYNMMKGRFKQHGPFPVLIRADWRARHKDVRSVMDICANVGIWRINFAAVKEYKVGSPPKR